MRLAVLCLCGFLAAVCSAFTSAKFTSADVKVLGGGASFPKAVYQRWAADYHSAHADTSVEYGSQGSGFGISGIINKTLDFAGSDVPMTKPERERAGAEVVHVPSVAGAVVMAYNLPDLKGELNLSGAVIADIYLGKIAKWNDPAIAAKNPGVALPDLAITPVYRSDASGTTFVFTSYLATQSKDFIRASPPGKNITITGGQAGKGNEGVSNTVTKIPGSVGYIELTYAINEKIPFAAIESREGKFVKASPESVSKAGEKAESLTGKIWNSPVEGAYPISSFTYLIVFKDLSYMNDEAKARSVVGFLNYAVTSGQSVATGLSYAPLPEAVKARSLEAIRSITFNGKPLAP